MEDNFKAFRINKIQLKKYGDKYFEPRPGLEDKLENYFEMKYVLTEKGTSTILEIIQEDNRSGAKQEEPQGEENPMLKGLKELIENKTN